MIENTKKLDRKYNGDKQENKKCQLENTMKI